MTVRPSDLLERILLKIGLRLSSNMDYIGPLLLVGPIDVIKNAPIVAGLASSGPNKENTICITSSFRDEGIYYFFYCPKGKLVSLCLSVRLLQKIGLRLSSNMDYIGPLLLVVDQLT